MNVPTSTAETAPVSWVSRVMSVPCSGAMARSVSWGNSSAVSFVSSRRTASGGQLCAVRYALR